MSLVDSLLLMVRCEFSTQHKTNYLSPLWASQGKLLGLLSWLDVIVNRPGVPQNLKAIGLKNLFDDSKYREKL